MTHSPECRLRIMEEMERDDEGRQRLAEAFVRASKGDQEKNPKKQRAEPSKRTAQSSSCEARPPSAEVVEQPSQSELSDRTASSGAGPPSAGTDSRSQVPTAAIDDDWNTLVQKIKSKSHGDRKSTRLNSSH